MKIVGFIPARGGSKRIANKNLQPILGIPLFLWAANNLNRVLPKENIYVDSDSEEILAIAEKKGFQTLKRPAELATNETNGNQFMCWEATNVEADVYIQHLPPMIFLRKTTIEEGIRRIYEGHDSGFTVLKEQFYTWSENTPDYDSNNLPNSFTLPNTIIEGMGFYITTREVLLKLKCRVGRNFYMIPMSKYEAIDIDYPEDLEFARTVAKGLGFYSEYTSGINKLKTVENIKLLVFDIDGVCTDGGMYYTESGDEFKKFNAKDGIGISTLKSRGYKVGFISSGFNENLIKRRAELLRVDFVYVGECNKLEILKDWAHSINIDLKNIVYLGDDINDLPLAKNVALFACPSDAQPQIKDVADIVLKRKGGAGCVREFIDKYII